ncbi:MAG: protein phosphatase 2C domain-containing protein [Lachnospiraceae bacterium]|nr:protein phosphatase 2C domain-containing protein [Lachnospiraceae bacterium]
MANYKCFYQTRKAADWIHVDNEDYMLHTRFSIMNDTSISIMVVSDGMGGLADGKGASRACAAAFMTAFYNEILQMYVPSEKNFTMSHYCDRLKTAAEHAFTAANAAVCENAEPGVLTGATLSAAILLGDYLLIGNVGDSPIYFYDREKDAMEIVSELMTLAEEEWKMGKVERFSKAYFEHDYVLTHYMGEYTTLPVSLIHFAKVEKVNPGDMLLLCSDGAVGQRMPEEILEILTEEYENQALQRLFMAAAADKDDDQTAILLKFT